MSDLWPFIRKKFSAVRVKPVLPWLGAFFLCLLVILIDANSSRGLVRGLKDFEVGKVADRDVIAEQAIIYEDEYATRLRLDAQEQLVPAVFQYSARTTEELHGKWDHFAAITKTGSTETQSRQTFILAFQSEFPGDFSEYALDLLYQALFNQTGDPEATLKNTEVFLNSILSRGIYSLPQTGLERLNPDVVELIRQTDTRIEREMVPLHSIVTMGATDLAIAGLIAAGSYTPEFIRLVPELLKPFLKDNVFYSHEETTRRILETRSRIEPVMRNIEQGKRIIRKGFVITEEEMEDLNALRRTIPGNNLQMIFSYILFFTMFFGFLLFFSGSRIIGRNLKDSETYLVSGLSALYISGSVLVRNIPVGYMPVSVVIPTALVMMLLSILVHSRLALVLAMTLPLGAFITGSFDPQSYFFALVSGVVAAYSLHGAEKRMDLVRAGLVIAAANVAVMIAIFLWQRYPAGVFPSLLFWAAFNGLASGMLVLGVLPPLEHALNASTTFRLIELSDLNAPVLRRLFTAAPGTYSHSIMVANLAETACQDIGANHLLARVGAYYHDLGKMEEPGYFVENQTDYNPHDDLSPRLSATVIRSHVKKGVEKARSLGLPGEVIDIISEHHGNSVITWFYSKALKQENSKKESVNTEDFCYSGEPPRSKESAVVMLADVTEAAVRTINKPTAIKIEKFIQELIAKKVEHGQLALSELSFRDLETIKNAFVRVLAGYYHSRIEYPKIDGESGNNGALDKEETTDK